MSLLSWKWDETKTTGTTTPAIVIADVGGAGDLTLDDLNYLIKCGKKNKKLNRILMDLLDGVTVELPLEG